MIIKVLLALSLLANVGLLLRSKAPKTQVVTEQKVVVKKSAPKVIERKVYVEVPAKARETSPAGATTVVEYDQKDMDDLISKVTEDRDEFLQGELGLTPPDYEKINKVKADFNRRYQAVVPDTHYGELTIEQKRQLLELDQQKEQELERAMGSGKWKRFQRFRDEYNHTTIKKQMHEKGMIIPMQI